MKSQSPLLLFVILLSLALNLYALAGDSFWGDEILTAIFAGESPADVIRWTATDIHPPLYYLAAGTFTRLIVPLGAADYPGQTSDWLWRFPSAVAGVLAIAVTYRLALQISYSNPALAGLRHHFAASAALLLCLAPIAIKYGQEARMHALFMLCSALSTWLFFRAMSRPQRWSRWLAYSLATTVSIYTMYFGFLVLAAHGGMLVASMMRSYYDPGSGARPECKPSHAQAPITGFTFSNVLAFVLYIPWWPVLFSILSRRAAVGAIEGGVGSPLDFVLGVVHALGPEPPPAAWGFLLLFIVSLLFLARYNWSVAIFGALWLAIPTALPIVLGDPRALQFRYAFVLPLYLTFIAYGAVNIGIILGRRLRARHLLNSAPSVSGPEDRIGSGELAIAGSKSIAIPIYLIWLLGTLSFIATLEIYSQTKPDWRSAAAYLNEHTAPADIILIGPLWDEGRFIDYYYRNQAQLLTPAALMVNIDRRIEGLRTNGGRIWAVNRFEPANSPTLKNINFSGVVISEPQLTVYEADLLTEAGIDLAAQAVEAAYPWAARSQAQGILDPDPRTAQAAALRALGDTLVTAGRPEKAVGPYQTAVDIFPGWVNGFIALAEAQEQVGNIPAAVAAYQQAVTYNLQWQGVQAETAAALVEAGEWNHALELYHQIIGD